MLVPQSCSLHTEQMIWFHRSCGQHCASFPYISSEHHQFNDFLPFFELVEIVISAQSNAQDFAAIFRYSTEKHT